MKETYRNQLFCARLEQYYEIMRTTIFAFVALAGIIAFAHEGAEIMLVILVVAVAVFGIVAGSSSLDDIGTLSDDMEEEIADSAFGRAAQTRSMGMRKAFTVVLIGLLAAAEVWTLYA